MSNIKKIAKYKRIELADYTKNIQSFLASHQGKISASIAITLLNALRIKDEYTYYHSIRVGYYSRIFCEYAGVNRKILEECELSSLLHDIGKIGTPEKILLRPERLNDLEYAEMKKHPIHSYHILKDIKELTSVAFNVKHHHERYDGKGYPQGLKGDNIPFASRLTLVSDTFDAMTSDRPYRKGLSLEVAYEELEDFSHSQFDPQIVNQFIECIDSYIVQPIKKAA